MDTNQIKIGFKQYAIERPDEIVETTGHLYGTANYNKAVIEIAKKYDQHTKNCTFLHELIHCICARFDLQDLNENEHTIDLLATGLYEIILDNPQFFKMTDI